MGGWQGGQAEYVLVPFADFSALKLPKDKCKPYILELAMLSDILPTAFNACVQAGVTVGRTVYIAGAGPVGVCAAACSLLLGAALVVVGDVNPDRLPNVEKLGPNVKTLDLHKVGRLPGQLGSALEPIVGKPEVDCSIDAVGFEAHGHGTLADTESGETVLNSLFHCTKSTGTIGVPGVYVSTYCAHTALTHHPPLPSHIPHSYHSPCHSYMHRAALRPSPHPSCALSLPYCQMMVDPRGEDTQHKAGYLPLQWGVAFNKGLAIQQGQCPVMAYHRELMQCILHDRLSVVPALNVKIITLEEAIEAYKHFSVGEACKYVLDPHNILRSQGLTRGAVIGQVGMSADGSAHRRSLPVQYAERAVEKVTSTVASAQDLIAAQLRK